LPTDWVYRLWPWMRGLGTNKSFVGLRTACNPIFSTGAPRPQRRTYRRITQTHPSPTSTEPQTEQTSMIGGRVHSMHHQLLASMVHKMHPT
jgi:hypothetical protein